MASAVGIGYELDSDAIACQELPEMGVQQVTGGQLPQPPRHDVKSLHTASPPVLVSREVVERLKPYVQSAH